MDILSAVDKALRETEPDQTPLTTAFIRELRRIDGGTKRNWPEGILLDSHKPEFTDFDRAVSAIAHSSFVEGDGPICTEDELAKLKEIQSRMEKTLEAAKKFSLSNVNNHLHGCRDKIEADLAAGKPLPEGIMVPSRDSVSLDFLAKQRALVSLLTRITHQEVVQLAKPILERFDRTVEQLMKDTEVGDRFICDAYGLNFHPSLLWKAASHIAMRYTAKSRQPIASAWVTPKTILEGIVEI